MATGSVTVNQVNNNQGDFSAAERIFLYIGKAGISTNDGKILAVSGQSDLDTLLGAGDSDLKTQVSAARANAASDNWGAYVIPIDPATDEWTEALDAALEMPNDLKIEAVVVCNPVTTDTEVTEAQAAMTSALTKYAKYIACFLCVSGIDAETESWSAYKTRIKAVIASITAVRVAVVPQLHGNDLGVLTGRLCNPAVSLADTPMRVATGALIGLGDSPVDVDDVPLTMADLTELSTARFSVPQWYYGYTGMYWADCMLLDAEGGDFQVYENLRILDYLARRVRILAIARIADRRLNSTSASMAANNTYFMRPLREAAKPITLVGEVFPAMIKTPDDGDIVITWDSKTAVNVAISAKPFNCPKKITVYLGLDLSN